MKKTIDLEARIARNKTVDRLFVVFGLLATFVGLLTLAALMIDLAMDGVGRFGWEFFTSFPSRFASRAGILSAWVGTILVMIVTAFTAVPLGVAAGVYLEEYAPKNWLTALIEINIANLAGVPFDRLRSDGIRPLCLPTSTWTERPNGRSDLSLADPADRYRRNTGGDSSSSGEYARSGLSSWSD